MGLSESVHMPQVVSLLVPRKPFDMLGCTHIGPKMGKHCLVWNLENKIKIPINSQQLTDLKKAANCHDHDSIDIFTQIIIKPLTTDSPASFKFPRKSWFNQECRYMRHFMCKLQNRVRTIRTWTSIIFLPKFHSYYKKEGKKLAYSKIQWEEPRLSVFQKVTRGFGNFTGRGPAWSVQSSMFNPQYL